jgi:hypothetical protein
LTKTQALIHAKKISLPWKTFSTDLITDSEICGMDHKLAMLYREGSYVAYYDGAGAQTFLGTGDFYGGNHTSKQLPISPDGTLDEIFSFLPLIDSLYSADNPYCVVDADQYHTTEDKAMMGLTAYTGTVYDVDGGGFAELLELLPILTNALTTGSVLTGAGDATANGTPSHYAPIYYPGMLKVSGISDTLFEDALEAKLIKLICGESYGASYSGRRGKQKFGKKPNSDPRNRSNRKKRRNMTNDPVIP